MPARAVRAPSGPGFPYYARPRARRNRGQCTTGPTVRPCRAPSSGSLNLPDRFRVDRALRRPEIWRAGRRHRPGLGCAGTPHASQKKEVPPGALAATPDRCRRAPRSGSGPRDPEFAPGVGGPPGSPSPIRKRRIAAPACRARQGSRRTTTPRPSKAVRRAAARGRSGPCHGNRGPNGPARGRGATSNAAGAEITGSASCRRSPAGPGRVFTQRPRRAPPWPVMRPTVFSCPPPDLRRPRASTNAPRASVRSVTAMTPNLRR